MTRLVHVLTVPESLRFLRGQPAFMRERGIETHVITSPGPLLDRFAHEQSVEVHPLPMTRAITPAQDLAALARLTALLSKLRPEIVHAHTPKGGLLGTMAARAARVPRVLYLTHVEAEVDGDTHFPEVDLSEWIALESRAHAADERHAFAF
ncbi:MAG: glycosyltransferase, partial [Sandaracinaceae bacterium]|nr:glycosyltransferase [Sandaracinaceae bacterium]